MLHAAPQCGSIMLRQCSWSSDLLQHFARNLSKASKFCDRPSVKAALGATAYIHIYAQAIWKMSYASRSRAHSQAHALGALPMLRV